MMNYQTQQRLTSALAETEYIDNGSIRKLEKAIVVYLVHDKWDEVGEQINKLNLKYWSRDYKEIIDLISGELGKKPDGMIINFLMLKTNINDLLDEFTPYSQIDNLIKEIAKEHKDRELKRIMQNSNNKTLEEVRLELEALSKETTSAFQPRSLGDVGKERIEEYELEAIAPSTGYKELDKYIKGFIPGHVYVLSGNTNVGKTAMCSNFVDRISKQKKTSLYFALEPENTIVDYLASIREGKRFANLTIEDRLVNDPHIHVFGKEKIRNIEDLVKAIRSLPRYDLIVVDHIGYFTANTSNTVSKQSDVMKDLAGIAKERKCAIMLVQHLNKSKIDKGSPENNITGSAAFKQDATDVLIITRDEEENELGANEVKNTGNLMIRKSKSDMSQGSIPIKFIAGSAVILDGSDQEGIVEGYYREQDDTEIDF